MADTTNVEVITLLPNTERNGDLDLSVTRPKALSPRSHREYLDTLVRPTAAELQRISNIQVEKEGEIDRKYQRHTIKEHDAAKLIQRAYRGHRERRQLNGLSLDPSSRWQDALKEWRYRSATAPHFSEATDDRLHRLDRNPSERAISNWRRAKEIAEHAGAGERTVSWALHAQTESFGSAKSKPSKRDQPESMILDLRYFLEMVDQKHRYGANLQVYHEEWQRSKTNQNFFYWLDRGEGMKTDLAMCPREKLEKECIRYLSREERKAYLVRVDSDGLLRWVKNDELVTTSIERYQDSMAGIVPKGSDVPRFSDEEVQRQMSADMSFSSKLAAVGGVFKGALKAHDPEEIHWPYSSSSSSSSSSSPIKVRGTHEAIAADHIPPAQEATKATVEAEKKEKKKPRQKLHVSPATILNHLLRASVRPGTWIYVADTLGRLYVGIKSSGAFQHASFLSGARISSAGTIGVENGHLTYLSPLSGHYRPTSKSFRRFIESLKSQGVDARHLKVSKAYSVLLGMELYGTSKKGAMKILRPGDDHRRSKGPANIKRNNQLLGSATLHSGGDMNAANTIESNWKIRVEDKKGLAKLMEGLNIGRRKSAI